jgi:hypothetical protein
VSLRWVVVGVLVLLLASVAWRYRGMAQAWLTPEPPLRPVLFENDHATPPPPPGSAAATPAMRAPGAMRKCVRGGDTTYTDRSCPPGFRERDVAADRVTVLPAAPQAVASQAGRRKTLKQALDVADDDRLRERMIDRAVQAGSR